MLGGCAGLLLNWACQGTCACEPWGREMPKRTAPGEALVSRHRTRVQFPPPPPLTWWPRHAVAPERQEGVPSRGAPSCVCRHATRAPRGMRTIVPEPGDDV